MSLPPGLTLSPAGVISGTPTLPGTFPFNVTVTDSLGATATATLQIVVSPSLQITVLGLPGAVAGQPYTFTLTSVGGTAPYQWSGP